VLRAVLLDDPNRGWAVKGQRALSGSAQRVAALGRWSIRLGGGQEPLVADMTAIQRAQTGRPHVSPKRSRRAVAWARGPTPFVGAPRSSGDLPDYPVPAVRPICVPPSSRSSSRSSSRAHGTPLTRRQAVPTGYRLAFYPRAVRRAPLPQPVVTRRPTDRRRTHGAGTRPSNRDRRWRRHDQHRAQLSSRVWGRTKRGVHPAAYLRRPGSRPSGGRRRGVGAK
jgi:hypothetical protein